MNPGWQRELVQLLSADPIDMDKVVAHKAQHFPEFIYKYVGWSDRAGADRALMNLQTDSVWLVSPQSFNDPFDSSVRVDTLPLLRLQLRKSLDEGTLPLANEHLAIIRAAGDPVEGLDNLFSAIVAKEHGAEVGAKAKSFFTTFAGGQSGQMTDQASIAMQRGLNVTCFSEVGASLPMWSYYANYHRGICLEYRVSALAETQARLLFPVIYEEERFDAHTLFARQLMGGQTLPFVSLPLLAAIHKSPDWAHEREWRIAAPLGPTTDTFQIFLGPPSSIRLGCRMGADDRQRVVATARRKKIPLYDVGLSTRRFELEVRTAALAEAAPET
jgi:hypothetical protein